MQIVCWKLLFWYAIPCVRQRSQCRHPHEGWMRVVVQWSKSMQVSNWFARWIHLIQSLNVASCGRNCFWLDWEWVFGCVLSARSTAAAGASRRQPTDNLESTTSQTTLHCTVWQTNTIIMTTQTMPGAVKLKEPPTYDGTMDYETIEAWLFAVENYFVLVRLTDEI